MKVIRRALGSGREQDSEGASRFVEEAQVGSQLDHPGIAPVHELGIDETGELYFTMRLVRGETFRAVIARARQSSSASDLNSCIEVLLKVCDTVAFAHSKSVIHRDLKPDNIMVGQFGEVYVMDWGLAKAQAEEDSADQDRSDSTSEIETVRTKARSNSSALQTVDGTVLGTPYYMSPEQAAGSLDRLGMHSDVYSIGAMLYEILTGFPPFGDSVKQTPVEVIERLCASDPTPISASRGVPRSLISICKHAMAREIENRYRDARELGEDLRAFIEHRVVKAHATGPIAELRTWVRRHRGVAYTMAAAALILVLSSIAWTVALSRSGDREREQRGLAEKSSLEARVKRTAAEKRLKDILLLALATQVEDLRERARNDLWPLLPLRADAVRRWIEEAERVMARGGEIRAELASLRREGKAPDFGDEDVRSDPDFAELQTWEAGRAHFAEDHPDARFVRGRLNPRRLEREIAQIDKRLTSLRSGLEERYLRFDAKDALGGEQRSWRFRELIEIEKSLQALDKDPVRLWDSLGIYGESLPVMRRRHAFIEEVGEICESEQAIAAWEEVKKDLSTDPRLSKLRLPMPGLIPLDKNPRTGLWEFWYVPSGSKPRLIHEQDDGSISRYAIEHDTGLVFVLLPGGDTTMGATLEDDHPRHDPDAQDAEQPLQSVTLEPFLISKYEMTIGQWARFVGHHPDGRRVREKRREVMSYAAPMISWVFGDDELRRMGLALPSEAQWEYACRGGTDSPWWPSAKETDLHRVAHFARANPNRTRRGRPARREWLRASRRAR